MLWGFLLTIRGLWRSAFWDRWLFRSAHLAGILSVGGLEAFGKPCPLTIWEHQLRMRDNPGGAYDDGFIIHFIDRLVYWDVDPTLLTGATLLIAGITTMAYILRPPQKIRLLFGGNKKDNGGT
jgi:hypothetical protein